MSEKDSSPTRKAGRIKDARGRRVKQLDPVALRLSRRYDVIEADVLRAITLEKNARMPWFKWAALLLSLILFSGVIGIVSYDLYKGRLPTARNPGQLPLMVYCLVWPYIVWWHAKRQRLARTAAAMLKYLRCPHCGYDLRGLPRAEDEATVCPECGCAWRLPDADSPGDAEPHL